MRHQLRDRQCHLIVTNRSTPPPPCPAHPTHHLNAPPTTCTTQRFAEARDRYVQYANELKLATAPYKAARDALVTAIADFTYSFFEGGGGGNGQLNNSSLLARPPTNYYKTVEEK